MAGDQGRNDDLVSYPTWLREAETSARDVRRNAVGGSNGGASVSTDSVGLALSGGGIRSATFSLGFVQALARQQVLRKVDFLSTVSGGGYIGAFLGGLFTDPNTRGSTIPKGQPLRPPTIVTIEKQLTQFPESFPVRWLRGNGRYLSPTGPGGTWLVGAILLRNWVAIVLVLAVGAFTLALFGELLHFGAYRAHDLLNIEPSLWQPHFFHGVWLSPIFIVPMAVLLGWAFAAGVAYWLVPVPDRKGTGRRRLIVVAAVLLDLAVLFVPRGVFFGWAIVAGIACGWPSVKRREGESGFPSPLLVAAFGVAVVLCLFTDGLFDKTDVRTFGDQLVQVPLLGRWVLSGLGLGAAPMTYGIAAGWVFLMLLQWLLVRGWCVDTDDRARHWLSHSLKGGLAAGFVASLVATGDSFGQTLYAHWAADENLESVGDALAGVLTAIGTIVLSAHKILAKLGGGSSDGKSTKIPSWVISLATLSVAVGLLVLAASMASFSSHAFVWKKCVPELVAFRLHLCKVQTCAPDGATWGARLLAACGVATAIAYLLGRQYPFVNQSSLASFYAARLTRAYLGASNPSRVEAARLEASPGRAPPSGGGSRVPTSAPPPKRKPEKPAETRVEPITDSESRAMSRVEPITGDEMIMNTYAPHERGGPLHIINVTLNETVDPRQQIHQADRHGLPMAVGPISLTVGTRHHAKWSRAAPGCWIERGGPAPAPDDDRFRVFTFPDDKPIAADPLKLGEWIAISGAAVATGMGSRTRVQTSLLLGMFNIRLGHWWDCGIAPKIRHGRSRALGPSSKIEAFLASLFPVYTFLAYELLGRFPGTANQHWYLSDGGHFENSGCYELIRRRLPFIVCCDNGADPDYLFSDIANLVRLARLDFGAEIEFFDARTLDEFLEDDVRPYFGTLEELKSTAWRDVSAPLARSPHAALARIRYANEDPVDAPAGGILLLVKPTVCGEEPLDIRSYRTEHPRFPQETTADQFFDEAQWEAYRRLGDHVGSCLFGDGKRDKWRPASLDGAELYGKVAHHVFARVTESGGNSERK